MGMGRESIGMQLAGELFDGVDQSGRGNLYFVVDNGDVPFADSGKIPPHGLGAEILEMAGDCGLNIRR